MQRRFWRVSATQTMILDYFEYSLEPVEDDGLRALRMAAPTASSSAAISQEDILRGCSRFLKKLVEAANNNNGKHPCARRFDRDLKPFGTYMYVTGGKQNYEVLQANLINSMPSPSLIIKHISKVRDPIEEGVLRFDELQEYLDQNNLPTVVFISEDGTRIISRVVYDSKTNRIVGLVGELDRNGLPDTSPFMALNEETVKNMFAKYPQAKIAYVIMAQPLRDGASAFCLGLFGTDNKFDSSAVLRRWNYIEAGLERAGIIVLGFSSDGDPKLLKAMRSKAYSGEKPQGRWKGWFGQPLNPKTVCVQDTTHVGTKLRVRHCKEGKILTMGRCQVSVTHLRSLIETCPKIEHGLTMSDLDGKDKMNFSSVLKITSDRVIKMLHHQPDAEGTEMYLIIIQHILDAFMDPDILADDRIFLLWKVVFFFLRLWRSAHIEENMSLEEHFITPNAYECIEMNAHAIIHIVRRLRNDGLPQHLIVSLMSSQPCEKIFRAARSLTSVFATVINFDLLQIMGRLRRIELQGHVIELLGTDFAFPRYEKKVANAEELMATRSRIQLLSDEEILQAVDRAREEAKDLAAFFHIHVQEDDDIITCPVKECIIDDLEDEEDDVEEPNPSNATAADEPEFDPDDVSLLASKETWLQGLEVQDFSHDSIWVYYTKENGAKVPIRKSTLCWQLAQGRERLSSDRLLRVQQEDTRNPREALAREIGTGEWCAWQEENGVVVGRVLAFRYLSGTGREQVYSLPTAPVTLPSGAERRGLGCICSFFSMSPTGILRAQERSRNMIQIEKYLYSLPSPRVVNGKLTLAQGVVRFIQR